MSSLRNSDPSLEPSDTPTKGPLVGERFELYRQLGEGTVATTYLAVEHCGPELRRLATLKLLAAEVADDAERLATLLANARCLAASTSPHLVAVRGASASGEEAFVASDYVAGESLLTILARCTQLERPPPTPIALRIAVDACAGLGALHGGACGRPLLHHALRPANLLVSYDGYGCLADAGIGATPAQLVADASLSVGLAQFIAPELLPEASAEVFGDPVGPTSDVYALGAALYVLVTLRFPFDDKQLGELIATKQQAGAVPARERHATVPSELEALLTRALSPMAGQRQQSAEELADELRFLIAEGGEPAEHRDVARWLAELFADQLSRKQRVLRKLLWPEEAEAQPTAPKPVAAGRAEERTKPVTVPPEPIPGDEGAAAASTAQPAPLPQTTLEEIPDEEPTHAHGSAIVDDLSRMPSADHVSFGRAIPTEEVSTERLPEERSRDADQIQTKVESPPTSTPRTELPADAPPPPPDDDEGDTAVTALQDVFSDSTTVRRQRSAPSSERSGKAVPPPAAESGATPEPEPAFGREPEQPEGDTVRAAKPEREWNATTTDLATIPFEDGDEKTDVGQLPAAEGDEPS